MRPNLTTVTLAKPKPVMVAGIFQLEHWVG